jgi:hypothetical protein
MQCNLHCTATEPVHRWSCTWILAESEYLLLFHATTMSLFYTIQRIIVYFSKICYHTLLQSPILSSPSIPPTTQVHASIMLVLPIVGNYKAWILDSLQWHNIPTKFHKNLSSSSRVEKQTGMSALQAFMFMHMDQTTHKWKALSQAYFPFLLQKLTTTRIHP